jgi:hypothetical protein
MNYDMKQRDFMARHPEDVGRTVEDFSWVLNVIVRPVRPRFRNADYAGVSAPEDPRLGRFRSACAAFQTGVAQAGIAVAGARSAPVERNLILRYKEALTTTRLPKGMQP